MIDLLTKRTRLHKAVGEADEHLYGETSTHGSASSPATSSSPPGPLVNSAMSTRWPRSVVGRSLVVRPLQSPSSAYSNPVAVDVEGDERAIKSAASDASRHSSHGFEVVSCGNVQRPTRAKHRRMTREVSTSKIQLCVTYIHL